MKYYKHYLQVLNTVFPVKSSEIIVHAESEDKGYDLLNSALEFISQQGTYNKAVTSSEVTKDEQGLFPEAYSFMLSYFSRNPLSSYLFKAIMERNFEEIGLTGGPDSYYTEELILQRENSMDSVPFVG